VRISPFFYNSDFIHDACAFNEQFMSTAATNPPPAKMFTRPNTSRPRKPEVAGGAEKVAGGAEKKKGER
jgi:hypothetical protein